MDVVVEGAAGGVLGAADEAAAVHVDQHRTGRAVRRRREHVEQVARVGTVAHVARHLDAPVGLLFLERRVEDRGLRRIDDAADRRDLRRELGRHAGIGLAAGCVLHQLSQLRLVELCLGSGAVTGGLLARRNQEHAAVLHALDLALEEAELGRIALVIGRVYRHQRRFDLLQPGRGIVVVRGFPLQELVVRVAAHRLDAALHHRVGLLARRPEAIEAVVAAARAGGEERRGDAPAARLLLVVAALPVGIVADRLGEQAPHHPVASRHLRRRGGHRHGDVHEARILLGPHPGLHAAHRVADHQAQVAHAEVLGDQAVLGAHHVVVVVLREAHAQAVGGLARFAGADRVGEDEVIALRVERLPGAEQLAGEARRQHASRRAGRAVQHQHRLAGRLADGGVVQLELRQHLARVEAEVAHDPVAFLRRGIVRGGRRERDEYERERCARTSGKAGIRHDGLLRWWWPDVSPGCAFGARSASEPGRAHKPCSSRRAGRIPPG